MSPCSRQVRCPALSPRWEGQTAGCSPLAALSLGTGFPLHVVREQIKILISGTHSRRPWALPVCAQLSEVRLNNGLGLSTGPGGRKKIKVEAKAICGLPVVPKRTWGSEKPGSPFTAFGFLVPGIRCTGTLSSTSFAFVFLYVHLRGVCTARLCEFQRLASGILPLPRSILVFETQFLIEPVAWLLVSPPPSPMDSDRVHPGDRRLSWPLHGY